MTERLTDEEQACANDKRRPRRRRLSADRLGHACRVAGGEDLDRSRRPDRAHRRNGLRGRKGKPGGRPRHGSRTPKREGARRERGRRRGRAFAMNVLARPGPRVELFERHRALLPWLSRGQEGASLPGQGHVRGGRRDPPASSPRKAPRRSRRPIQHRQVVRFCDLSLSQPPPRRRPPRLVA